MPTAIDGTQYHTFEECGIVRESINTLDGLDHLEGQKVAILANGEFLGFQTVLSGQITLLQYYSKIIIGLPYLSDFQTLDIEVPDNVGTLVGRKVKVSNVVFRMIKSMGGKIGPKFTKMYEAMTARNLLVANQTGQLDAPLGDTNKLYTTDIRQPLGAEYTGGGRICYRQVKPLPITIGAILPELTISNPGVGK